MGLVTIAFITTAGYAKWYPHQQAKVSVDIPEKWKVEGDENTLSAESKDGAAALMFMVLEAESLDAALESLDQELGKIIKDFKEEGEPQEITVKGMKAISADGNGIIEGKPAKIGLLVIQSPSGKAVLVLGAVQATKWAKHKKAITKIMKSLKPIK